MEGIAHYISFVIIHPNSTALLDDHEGWVENSKNLVQFIIQENPFLF